MKRNGQSTTRAPSATSPFPAHWNAEMDWVYSEKIYPNLVRKYPNRWIAVAHHRVLASGTNVLKVLTQARRQIDWPEIPLTFLEQGIHVYGLHGH